MKKVAVLYVVNSDGLFDQSYLDQYQSEDCFFKFYATDTDLKEITNAAEAEIVIPKVFAKIKEAADDGVDYILLYAFGELPGAKDIVNTPVISLGIPTLFTAYMLCKKSFTIINSVNSSTAIFEDTLKEHGLISKYKRANQAANFSPLQLKKNQKEDIISRLVEIASIDIEEQGIDTFTLGCGHFCGFAKPLEQELKQKYPEKSIIVLDPVEFTMNLVKAL